MPSETSELVLCYNRGCGSKFDPKENKEDSCLHHPGAPVFHDAYKGWSCCNKKCTDFTEFLNIKGCTKSYHSNVKPPEPERPVIDKSKSEEVIEYKAPIQTIQSSLERPSFESPLVILKCEIASSLKTQLESLQRKEIEYVVDSGTISVGTSCKNGGCKVQYEGPESNSKDCIYHPGCPIFHEGLKFWSCCQKRTTDFNSFLEQIGCKTGKHIWHKWKEGVDQMTCRYDWHQTGTHVVVSVYAKKYDPYKSKVEANPIRLRFHLEFPEEEKTFDLDMELRGVISVERSECSMLSTKIEVKLKKAEPGSWSKLDFPRQVEPKQDKTEEKEKSKETSPQLDSVDLSDIY